LDRSGKNLNPDFFFRVMRIGCYICHCGLNIAGVVDVARVRESIASLPDVLICRDYRYICSDPGQELIKNDIKEKNLDRVVVAACSPRMHEPTFRGCVKEAGLNPYLFEMANIREQCSWVHLDREKATEKAEELVKMAVSRARLLEPLKEIEVDVIPRVLVIGGGIAGIQASLDLADSGYDVFLVEREPSIGGRMAQLDKTFPTLDCSACILTPKMVDVARNPRIKLITYAEVKEVEGYIGNFRVKILKKPRYVDEEKCNGCGECAPVCPYIRTPHEFDAGLRKRGNIWIPFPQAVPLVYVIDRDKCTGCGNCRAVCEPDAIDLYQLPEEIEIEVGAIVVATGYDQWDAREKPEYKYGMYDNVITGLEFERLSSASGPTEGKIVVGGREPKKIVFVQCCGSRDQRGNEYCSRICCMYTAKQAHLIKEKIPDAELTVFYMDVRAFGKGFEEFYDRVRKEGVTYRRGNVAEILSSGERLLVRAEDTLLGEIVEIQADLVVLATAIVPRRDASELARMLKISQGPDSFFLEAHPKLRPVDTLTDGVFLAGCCQGPKDIPDSVAQASGAAARVATILSKKKLKIDAIVASVREEQCSGCGLCEAVCPFGAIEIMEGKARVNEAICKGCGSCSGTCPSGANKQLHFKTSQVFAQIDACMEA
jgi:heterodisulfide reductase subunit A